MAILDAIDVDLEERDLWIREANLATCSTIAIGISRQLDQWLSEDL